MQLCKYNHGLMCRSRATLILIAILVLLDLIGAALLRDAWNDRHDKAALLALPASRAEPTIPVPLGEASAVHAGI